MATAKKITGKTQKGRSILNLSEIKPASTSNAFCGPMVSRSAVTAVSTSAYKMRGATCRPGLCRCRDCKKQFTVTVGTIFEDSHLPLSTWVKAFHLMCSSKKGISALQLQRNLGLGSYRTAWFMAHRIRLAMKCEPMAGLLKGDVQVDETYVGPNRRGRLARPGETPKKRGRGTDKQPVMVLVARTLRPDEAPSGKGER